MNKPDNDLAALLATLARAEGEEEEEALGRGELASLLHRAPHLLDRVLILARRDNRVRRCLAAARYYSGLNEAICAKIDALLRGPFPAAADPKRGPRRR